MKKKSIFAAGIVLLFVFLSTCAGPFTDPGLDDGGSTSVGGGGGNGPIDVALAFLKATKANNLPQMRKYITPESVFMLELVMGTGNWPGYSDMVIPPRSSGREEITGDTARVYFDDNRADVIYLVKIDGAWKVDLKKFS